MKTHFKFPIIVLLLISITCCTNNNNKANKISFNETVTVSLDTTNSINTPNYPNNDTNYVVWRFLNINNEDVSKYIHESTPFIIFSLDSTFALINTGCNIYIGECTLTNNNIKFEKIKIKEEICPIDALEREIVYMLESSNNYLLNNNNLILFTNDYPIGLLTMDTINSNSFVMP